MFNLTLETYRESAYLSRANPSLFQSYNDIFNEVQSMGDKLYIAVNKSYEVYKRNQAFSLMGLILDAYSASYPGTEFSKSTIVPKSFSYVPRGINIKKASVGFNASTNYRNTFFKANPSLEGEVVVHHAVEQQVLKRYPGLFKAEELNSIENLRGIPKNINSSLHLSKIRKAWNKFYKNNSDPTKQEVLGEATRIDNLYGILFNPKIR